MDVRENDDVICKVNRCKKKKKTVEYVGEMVGVFLILTSGFGFKPWNVTVFYGSPRLV